MSGHIRRSFRFVYLSSLVVCLVGPISGAGCSKGVLGRRPDLVKTWTCDKRADKAMEQHDYEAGILLHQRFLDREPANGLVLYHLGYAYSQTGNHVAEVSYYEKAIAQGFEQKGIFFNLGMAYGELNQIADSIRAFRKALAVNPKSADSHFGLGIAYQRSVADQLAEEEFLEAIKVDPAHVDARLHLSMLYADKGELQKAKAQLREILEIAPAYRRAREFLERIERE